MLTRMLVCAGVVCYLLSAATESHARGQRVLSGPVYARSITHRSPIVRSPVVRPQVFRSRVIRSTAFRSPALRHPPIRFARGRTIVPRFYSPGYATGDLVGTVIEAVVEASLDSLMNAAEAESEPAYMPANLSSLDGYAVPTEMQPHVYGLLTSGNPADVDRAHVLLTTYEALALDRAEGLDRRRVRSTHPLVLPHPLDTID